MISSDVIITNNLSGIWLIEFGSYRWSSSDYTHNDEFYSGKIKDFNNFTESVCRPNDKQISEKTLEFSILDEEKEISATKGDELTLRLIINGEQFLVWKFVVRTFTNFYGNSNFTCIDFFSFKIQNKFFPNTQLINTLDSSSASHSGTEDACIPVIFGEPYIPLRSIKINGYQRYILGIDDGDTYSIDRIAYPIEWGSSTEYLSTSYTFTQESFSGLRVFTPYIGANNTAGHFQSGDSLLDAPVKYSKSSTSTLTDYSDVIKNVLISLGISSSYINTASFDNCKSIFASIGLECNVGYWYKRPTEEVICELLASCNSIIQIYDQVYLQYIGDSSVIEIDKYDISGFNPSESLEDNYGDSGILQYYEDIQYGDPINVYIPLNAGVYNTTFDISQSNYVFEKVSGTESWDSESITSSFYFSDGCRLRFSFDSWSGEEMIVGLSSSVSSTPDYLDIDYGFVVDSLGEIHVYENGVDTNLSLAISSGDIFEIIYNGTSIIYNVNNINRKTTTGVSTSLDFYLEAQIKDIGGTFSILSFDQYIKTDENEDSKSFLIPFTSDSVLCQKIARLYFRRSNLKIGEVSFNSRKRLLAVECGDTITIDDEIYHSDDYYVTQKSIGFDLSLSFTCDRYSEPIGSLSDFSPSEISFDSSLYDYIVPLSERWLKEIYIRSISEPDTPIGESPAGWDEEVPTGTDPIWMSKGWFRNDGTFISGGVWTTPVRISGLDGSTGTDARSVTLSVTDQSILYDTTGLNPNPASCTATATSLNTVGDVYYEFFLNDSSVQNTTSNEYAYTSESSYANMPSKIVVHIREGASIGTVVAADQISIYGIKEGSSGITAILSNEAHTLPTTNAGVVTYTGSGTDFEIYEGATQLTIDQTAPYANGTYRVTATGTYITPGSTSGSDGDFILTYGDHSNMTQNGARIEYDIVITNFAGSEVTLTKIQSFSKSIQGDDGEEADYSLTGSFPVVIVGNVKRQTDDFYTTNTANWGRYIYSERPARAGAQLIFNPNDPAAYFRVGLIQDPTTYVDAGSIEHAFNFNVMGDLTIRDGGIYRYTHSSDFSSSTLLEIRYNNRDVLYYVDNVLCYTAYNVGRDRNYYFIAGFPNSNTRISNVFFGKYSDVTDYRYGELGLTYVTTSDDGRVERIGNSFKKIGGRSTLQSKIYTLVYYTGSCHLRFSAGQLDGYFVAGLVDSLTTSHIDFSFEITADNEVYVKETNNITGAQRILVATSYDKNTVFEIIYDWKNITYYINNEDVRSVDVSDHPNLAYYFWAAIYTPYAEIRNVSFDRYGDVTTTVIDGGVITTGYIGDDFPTSLGGTPSMCIDFANALIEIGNDGGLIINSGGGITVSPGGDVFFSTSEGGDPSRLYFSHYVPSTDTTYYADFGFTGGENVTFGLTPRESGYGYLYLGNSLLKWDEIRLYSSDSIYMRSDDIVGIYANNNIDIGALSASGDIDIAGGTTSGVVNITSGSLIALESENITLTSTATEGGIALSCPERTTNPTVSELPVGHCMIFRLTGESWLAIAWNVGDVIYAWRITN